MSVMSGISPSLLGAANPSTKPVGPGIARAHQQETAMAHKTKRKDGRRQRKPTKPNPLLEAWTTPFQMPPFDRVKTDAFLPAFDKGFSQHRKEIAAIVRNREPPTFANLIDALERSGNLLERVSAVFFNLAATDTNEEIQAIERALAPRFAKHNMGIYQDATLFARVDALFKTRRRLKLTEEQARVLQRYHRAFVKAGAWLAPKAKKRMAAIAARM